MRWRELQGGLQEGRSEWVFPRRGPPVGWGATLPAVGGGGSLNRPRCRLRRDTSGPAE